MKKAFRDAYNRELSLLYERAAEFSAEYPGIADRLGGLLRENTDPAVAGLLEGSAFLAARVQLKMDEEFRNFTTELLEQIFPDALAPIPSVMLVQANPPFENKDLENGISFKPGDYLDARFVDSDRRVSCRFRLGAPLTLWPLKLSAMEYHPSPAPVAATGLEITDSTVAGLSIELQRPAAAGGGKLSDLKLDSLPFYFTAAMPDAVALYEQIHCDLLRVSLRYLNSNGDPVFVRLAPHQIEQIGFDPEERAFPRSSKLFDGFAQLREAFVFPRKYLGFRLTGLQDALRSVATDTCQLVFEFDTSSPTLAARLKSDDVRIHAATAVNLFEESASQVRLDQKRHEFVVTPDSSPVTHYEIHQITEVFAHYTGAQTKVKVAPLYGLPEDATNPRSALYFTTKRKERRLTDHEKRFGRLHRYRGTETFVALYEPPNTEDGAAAQRLQIKTLCSNRHLPEYLPIAGSLDDFHMTDDVTVSLACVGGPTPPREPMSELEKSAPHRAIQGDVYWRIISYLSLSHFGLDDRGGDDGGAALREVLSLFADLGDASVEAQVQGIIGLDTRQITRSIQRSDGFFPARGVEVKLTLDEEAYEGSGIILMGAILDRFFAEYATINSFTQTVIASRQRGVIKTWPARTGSGPLL